MLRLFAALALIALGGPAFAQSATNFPDRPIRIVVPYPPGGSTDPVARLIAADMQARLGQPVIVDNRSGGAGSIGTEFVARAPADGYTILFHTSVITTDPSFKRNVTYDVARDLFPLAQVATGPYLVVTNNELPARNMAELIAYARANPGQLNFGSAGIGSSGHLIGELFRLQTGIDVVHVPYRGGGPSITGLMGNEVQFIFDTVSTSRPLVEGGRLRGLAVTSAERAALMPDTPTMAESGVPDFVQIYWLGMFLPSGVPPEIRARLYEAIRLALESPLVRERTAALGIIPRAVPPEEFARIVNADIEKWRRVITEARIEPQ